MNDLVPVALIPASELALASPADILEAWLSGRNPRTLRAYAFDLSDFARFVEAPSPAAAVEVLMVGGQGLANRLALAYRAHLTERNLASATIARRLAALRSLVKLARMLGRIAWTLDVESPRTVAYRDTTGPGRDGFELIRREAGRRAAHHPDAAASKRNLALILLLHDLALRRGEAVALDLADVELDAKRIHIIGKGKTEPERMTINDRTAAALRDWIAVRGPEPGPLFIRLDRGAGDQLRRLTGESVNRMVRRTSWWVGLEREARAHGLRHQGITRALDLTKGNVRTVRKFSRHAKLETLGLYDDARTDEGGNITRMFDDD